MIQRGAKTKDGKFQEWLFGRPRPIIEIRVLDYLQVEIEHIKAVLVPALNNINLKVEDLKPDVVNIHQQR